MVKPLAMSNGMSPGIGTIWARLAITGFGETAIAGHGDDAVADLQIGDAFADRIDDAGGFTARRKRQRRFELVKVLDDQRVGEIDPGGMDLDAHLALAGLGRRNVLTTSFSGGPCSTHRTAFIVSLPRYACLPSGG